MSAATDSTMLRTAATPARTKRLSPGATVVKWVTTTDHKVIGNLYFITSFVWFIIGGLMALLIRAELFEPGLQVVEIQDRLNVDEAAKLGRLRRPSSYQFTPGKGRVLSAQQSFQRIGDCRERRP